MEFTNNELLDIPVKHIMSKDVITASPIMLLQEVDEIFSKENIHHLPVVSDDNELQGILSEKDLLMVKHWGSKYNSTVSDRKNKFLFSKLTVSDIMSNIIETVGPEDTLEACSQLFYANKYHALPVIENGKLVGIITSYDLLITAYKRS